MKSGQTIGGTLSEETADQYVVNAGTDVWSVKKSDIQSATPAISAMPPMGALLTPAETRDNVAVPAMLTTASKPKPPQPKPFQPAKQLRWAAARELHIRQMKLTELPTKLRSLAVGSLALTSSLLPSSAADPVRDDSASEKLGIKLSIQCYTYRAITFYETVDKAAKMGIKYLEIYPGQMLKPDSPVKIGSDMSDEVCAEIQAKLAAAGGEKIVAFGVAPIPNDEPAARKVFEWARKMEIEVLVTETVPTEVHDKLCTEFNIRMALHNHPKTWSPDEVLAAVKDRSKLIGSCSDTGHWMRRNLVPVEQMKKLEGRIEHSHFKDLNEFGEAHDLPWGTGKGDAKGMLTELKHQGFKGYTSIEYEVGSVAELDVNLPLCVAFYDKTLAELAK